MSIQARLFNLLLRLTPRTNPARLHQRQLRKLAKRADRWFARIPSGVSIQDVEIAGIPAHWIKPRDAPASGIILLLHGGAWCIETPALHAGFAARLALALGKDAVIPRYRLAPEYPFPAAFDDCRAAWTGLIQSGIRAEEVVLVGDSAGGALALALLGHLRDAGEQLPECALLVSPCTDLATMGRSVIDNEKSDAMFGASTLLLLRHWYLGDTSPTDPVASPYWADFTGFPPLFFQVSGSEMLLDSSRLAEAKARRQGVKTEISIWPGMPHDFPLFPALPESARAIHELVSFARKNFFSGQSV